MKRIVQILAAAALLIALSLTAFATASGATKVQTRGDLNGDGACTLSDVLGIFRKTLEGGQHTSQYAADIDGNGSVNLRDALLLLQNCLQPSEPLPSRTLTYLSKSSYAEKTEAGFLGQLVGMISGYEFAQTSDGRQYVGMPDSWYAICAGPYGAENSHWHHTVKRIYITAANFGRSGWTTTFRSISSTSTPSPTVLPK